MDLFEFATMNNLDYEYRNKKFHGQYECRLTFFTRMMSYESKLEFTQKMNEQIFNELNLEKNKTVRVHNANVAQHVYLNGEKIAQKIVDRFRDEVSMHISAFSPGKRTVIKNSQYYNKYNHRMVLMTNREFIEEKYGSLRCAVNTCMKNGTCRMVGSGHIDHYLTRKEQTKHLHNVVQKLQSWNVKLYLYFTNRNDALKFKMMFYDHVIDMHEIALGDEIS